MALIPAYTFTFTYASTTTTITTVITIITDFITLIITNIRFPLVAVSALNALLSSASTVLIFAVNASVNTPTTLVSSSTAKSISIHPFPLLNVLENNYVIIFTFN